MLVSKDQAILEQLKMYFFTILRVFSQSEGLTICLQEKRLKLYLPHKHVHTYVLYMYIHIHTCLSQQKCSVSILLQHNNRTELETENVV